MMPAVSPGSFRTELRESGLRHRSRGLRGQPHSEPVTESDHCFWFPHIISSSDNSRVNHSAISRIKPTQAEFPKLHPLPGNCRAVRGLHLAYNSISIRTRFSATSHLVEQKENYTLLMALLPQLGAVKASGVAAGSAPSQLCRSRNTVGLKVLRGEMVITKPTQSSCHLRLLQRSNAIVTCEHIQSSEKNYKIKNKNVFSILFLFPGTHNIF